MSWFERAKRKLESLSEPSASFEELIRQWKFTGECSDYRDDDAKVQSYPDCQLCGHESIRFGFTIKNDLNSNQLIVGNVCITKFRMATNEELNRISDKVVREAILKRVAEALYHLEPDFLVYYIKRGGFTPKQAVLVFHLLTERHVQFKKADFKILLRRNREKQQLIDCLPEIEDCLTLDQWKIVGKMRKCAEKIKNHTAGIR